MPNIQIQSNNDFSEYKETLVSVIKSIAQLVQTELYQRYVTEGLFKYEGQTKTFVEKISKDASNLILVYTSFEDALNEIITISNRVNYNLFESKNKKIEKILAREIVYSEMDYKGQGGVWNCDASFCAWNTIRVKICDAFIHIDDKFESIKNDLREMAKIENQFNSNLSIILQKLADMGYVQQAKNFELAAVKLSLDPIGSQKELSKTYEDTLKLKSNGQLENEEGINALICKKDIFIQWELTTFKTIKSLNTQAIGCGLPVIAEQLFLDNVNQINKRISDVFKVNENNGMSARKIIEEIEQFKIQTQLQIDNLQETYIFLSNEDIKVKLEDKLTQLNNKMACLCGIDKLEFHNSFIALSILPSQLRVTPNKNWVSVLKQLLVEKSI